MGKSAFESSRRVGERMVDDEVAWLGRKSKDLLDAYTTVKPDRRMRTFEEVERFWDDVVRPRFREFKTMQENWQNDPEIPESSVWHANWRVPGRS